MNRITMLDLLVLLAIVAAIAAPSLTNGAMYPFDSTLFAANGALFEAAYRDIGGVLSAPGQWLWDYYTQYPALFVRRHPPLYGAVEGVIFTIGGVSMTAAKLTIAAFGVLFGFAAYALGRAVYGERAPALLNAAVLLTVPMVGAHYTTIWADLPAMAFGLAAFAVYVNATADDLRRPRVLVLLALAALGALYMYPMVSIWFVGLGLFHLWRYRLQTFRQGRLLVTVALVAVACVPLVAQQVLFAEENLQSAVGGVAAGSSRFVPTADMASFKYWTYYVYQLATKYPVQLAGAALWLLLLPRRKPPAGERLLAFCAALAYVLLSVISVKNGRYAMYISVPLSFLATAAVWSLLQSIPVASRRASQAVAAAGGIAIVALQVAVLPKPTVLYGELFGIDRIAADVTGEPGASRFFYSGRFDGAFVFAVRSLDDDRKYRIARATVQVDRVDALPEFWRRFDPDFVLVEQDDADSDVSAYNDFRDGIGALLRGPDAPYRLWRTYRLDFAGGVRQKDYAVNVYRRASDPKGT
jgi:hypothetical protein